MKKQTPNFKFIKNHFKNATIVYSAFFKDDFDIKDYDFKTLYEHAGSIYIIHKTKPDYVKSLYDIDSGLAEISIV